MGAYHFSRVGERSLEQRTVRRADMETFYALAQIAFDTQQTARIAAEDILTKDAIESYAEPINLDEWHDNGTYLTWRKKLRTKISKEVKQAAVDSFSRHKEYHKGRSDKLEFDFSHFLESEDEALIEVSVIPDTFDEGQNMMLLNISTEPGRYIGVNNRDTGFSIAMRVDSLVGVEARPFTMADAVYDFTGIFKRDSPNVWDFEASRDTVDEFAWYIWAAEEILGLLEANLRHEIRFATDERATYSLAHMIIAYKEKQHFGTYDYLHVVREVLRPWIGDEEGGREFIELLKRGMQSGYIDLAIGVMKSGSLMEKLNALSWDINDYILRVVARLDSSLISESNFPEDYIPKGGFMPDRGAVQQLHTARDVSALDLAKSDLRDIQKGIESAAAAPALFRSRWIDSLNHHRGEVGREYREFVGEVSNAESSLDSALLEVRLVEDSLRDMEQLLNESKCESQVASQLLYGSGGALGEDGIKGLEDILPVKRDEAVKIAGELDILLGLIAGLKYVEDESDIDETYASSSTQMQRASNSLVVASTFRDYYYSCRESWSTSHSSPTPGCEESRTVSEDYECGTEEAPATCTRSWVEYRCTCKDYYMREYTDRMTKAGDSLLSSIEEIESLEYSINNWFDERGYEKVLDGISEAHGHKTGGGLMGFYYRYHGIKTPHRGYVDAFEYALNLSESKAESHSRMPLSYTVGNPVEEDFSAYGYIFIHTVINGLHASFNLGNAAIRYENAEKALESMRDDGFFAFLLELTTSISDLMSHFGDALGTLSAMDRDYVSFPMLREHLYASFSLPPFGKSTKGFSLLHDIRIRADNRPAAIELSLPLLGEYRIELNPRNGTGKGYSIPIPFTPLNIFAWEFHIVRSQVGSKSLDPEAVGEKSILWLVDYENQGTVASIATVRLDNESVPVPIYLHRPLMYKYEFTAGEYEESLAEISKSFESGELPPVIVIALGPFATNFGGWFEPPDSKREYLPVNVYLEESPNGLVVSADLPLESRDTVGSFLLKVYETGNVDRPGHMDMEIWGSLKDLPREFKLEKTNLSLLKTYGWTLVNADIYVLDVEINSSDFELMEHVIGEDHASLPIIDPDLNLDVRLARHDGTSIDIVNRGNRRVEVVVKAEKGCCFFREGNTWERNMWTGSIGIGTKRVEVRRVGPVSLELRALLPLEVERLIRNSADMHLQEYYKIE
jgi:hypothetical protein